MLIMIPFHFISGLENAMQALQGSLSGLHLSWRSQLGQRICTVAYSASAQVLRIDIEIICWISKSKHYSLYFVPCGDQMNPLPYRKH